MASETPFAAIELRHLRYFVAAAEHGSLRKASRALVLQESTISRGVRDLEDRLGASLFQRRRDGVKLTFAGECFLRRTCIALQEIGKGARDVAAIGRCEDGRLKVGTFSSVASGFVLDLLRSYNTSHAGVRIDLVDGNPASQVAAIRQLQLDVAFVSGTNVWPGCEIDHLWSERIYVILPRSHPLSEKEEICWSDLINEHFTVTNSAPGPEIKDYLVQRFAELGQHPDVQTQDVSRGNLLLLVAAGLGLTLTREASTTIQIPDITYRPIYGDVLPFSAVWSPRNDNPALRRLLSMARQMSVVSS